MYADMYIHAISFKYTKLQVVYVIGGLAHCIT